MEYNEFIDNVATKATQTFAKLFIKNNKDRYPAISKAISMGVEEINLPSFHSLFNEYFIAESSACGVPSFFSEHFAKHALTAEHELELISVLSQTHASESSHDDRVYIKNTLEKIIDINPPILPDSFIEILGSDGYYWRNIIDTVEFSKLHQLNFDQDFVRKVISIPYSTRASNTKPLAMIAGSTWGYSAIAKNWKTYDFFFESEGEQVYALNQAIQNRMNFIIANPADVIKSVAERNIDFNYRGFLDCHKGDEHIDNDWLLDPSIWSITGHLVEFEKLFKHSHKIEPVLFKPNLIQFDLATRLNNLLNDWQVKTLITKCGGADFCKVYRDHLKTINLVSPSQSDLTNLIACSGIVERVTQAWGKVSGEKLRNDYYAAINTAVEVANKDDLDATLQNFSFADTPDLNDVINKSRSSAIIDSLSDTGEEPEPNTPTLY